MIVAANRDRALIGVSAVLAIGVPAFLLWPRPADIHPQPYLMVTPLPPIKLALSGAATTAPLFNSERSPAPIIAPGSEQPGGGASAPIAPPAPPTLVGLALNRGSGVALLKSVSGQTTRVGIGQDVDGWRVVAISSDHVVVEQAYQRTVLGFDFSNQAAGGDLAPRAMASPQPIPLPPNLRRGE